MYFPLSETGLLFRPHVHSVIEAHFMIAKQRLVLSLSSLRQGYIVTIECHTMLLLSGLVERRDALCMDISVGKESVPPVRQFVS